MTNLNENKNLTPIALDDEMLELVDGAGWLGAAWDATCNWASKHKKTLAKVGCIVGGTALAATGIGAGAAVGLFTIESVAGTAVAATTVGGFAGTVTGTIIYGPENEE